MVRTRSQTRAREESMRLHAREIIRRRQSILERSPSKASRQKQQQKDKRNSAKFEKMLSSAKANLAKASERILNDRPVQPRTLFDEIHYPIISGEAKQNLRHI